MLVGPMLAIAVPAVDLIHRLDDRTITLQRMMAIVIVGLCVLYATSITLFQGEWVKAAAAAVKWYAPLLYAAAIVCQPERESLLDAAAAVFRILLPITGLYGIWQYVDPPEWDRYWLLYANTTAGLPLPFEVRTFSMMNGPATFATFTAAGLMLVGVLRGNLVSLLLIAPALVSFLLSSYRTAWISLFAGLIFCIAHPLTRARAGAVLLVLAGGVLVALSALPFSEAISGRLASFGQGSQDGSAQERLQEFVTLWNAPDSALWGMGLTNDSFLAAGDMPVDGMLVACWLSMGLVVGLVCLCGFLLGAWTAIETGWRSSRRELVAVAALAVGALVQLPLANIGSGELGFLFWFVAALGTRPATRSVSSLVFSADKPIGTGRVAR